MNFPILLALSGALLTVSAPLALHDVLRDAPPPAHTGGFGEPTCLTCHFGDANDPASAVSRLVADGRAYKILEDINVGPQVSYLTRIKNRGENV